MRTACFKMKIWLIKESQRVEKPGQGNGKSIYLNLYEYWNDKMLFVFVVLGCDIEPVLKYSRNRRDWSACS